MKMKNISWIICLCVFLVITNKCFSEPDNTEKTTFPSGENFNCENIISLVANDGDFNLNDYKVEKLDTNDFKKLLKNKNGKKTVVHFWSTWCTHGQLDGIDEISKLMKNPLCDVVLVSIDLCSKEQVDFLKRVIHHFGIQKKTYIIENPYTKLEDMDKIVTFDHLKKFLNLLKPGYDKTAFPYTAVLDKNGKIIYENKYCEFSSEELTQLMNGENANNVSISRLDYNKMLKAIKSK